MDFPPPLRLRTSASSGLAGSVEVPGDKSISHRAVILAAMANGTSRISGLCEGLDVGRTLEAVQALGARVEAGGPGEWLVSGCSWRSPVGPIDCGNSGTAARLLMGAIAGRAIRATLTGDQSLSRRSMERVAGPLRLMGADVTGGDHLPLTVQGGRLGPLAFVNATGSAQVKSAVLLAGVGATGPVEITEPLPSRDHTERMLGCFGIDVQISDVGTGTRIALGQERSLRAVNLEVPGDPSAAAFPLVAALITPGSEVTVRGVLVNPLRTGIYLTLQEMGADLVFTNRRMVGGEPVADITARSSALRGVTIPIQRVPAMIDEYPVLAMAAATALGETSMLGLGELRHKESDRLAAIAAGLEACGIAAEIRGDDLIVSGARPRGGQVQSRGDHRIAMSFLTLGLASTAPMVVDGSDMIATSFPGFDELMRGIGARISTDS